MGDGHEGRIATLEANQKNADKTMDAILGYMREGRVWRENTTICLVKLTERQTDCEGHEDRIGAVEGRIKDVEGFQGRLIKISVAIITAISGSAAFLPDFFKWLRGG